MYEGYNRYAGSAGGVAEEIVGEAVAHRRGDYIPVSYTHLDVYKRQSLSYSRLHGCCAES